MFYPFYGRKDEGMIRMVYIVICCCIPGDKYYDIDSVWTSERKAQKRCDELNAKGEEYLLDNYGNGLYGVECEMICT